MNRDARGSSFDPFAGWEPAPDSLLKPTEPRTPPAPSRRPPPPIPSSFGPPPLGPGPGDGLDSGGFSFEFDPHPHSRSRAGRDRAGSASRSGSSNKKAIRYPARGQVVAGFRIVNEIGRGAFARVYLAEQVDLADRKVALKVSPPLGEEPQVLARFQHTHIVPIHSVHDDPETGLRLLCMPYLGGANLAQVLDAAESSLPTQATGRSLIAALDEVGAPSLDVVVSHRAESKFFKTIPNEPIEGAQAAFRRPRPSPSMARSALRRYIARLPWWTGLDHPRAMPQADGEPETMHPARRYFRQSTYLQSTVWIAARLAEALEHAHSRGLLHRDIKPSNILLAADGTPMLLDFNLSAEVRRTGDPDQAAGEVGGTLPYMAPEHLDAFDPEGKTPAEQVDQRSDLYSLGLILFEMVTGRHPFPTPPADWPLRDTIRSLIADRVQKPPSARACNEAVPWGLDSILRKCLDPRPELRYQSAGDLAEDLRRFLDDQPLAFAPEVSLSERAAKWARRHPRACSAGGIGGLAAILLVAVAVSAGLALRSYELVRARYRWDEFQRLARDAQMLANTASGPIQHLADGIDQARKALALYRIEPPQKWPAGNELRGLDAADRLALRRQIPDLMVVLLRAEHREASARRDEELRAQIVRKGIPLLDWAETVSSQPPRALYDLRAEFEEALGQTEAAGKDRLRAEATPVKTPQEMRAQGIYLLERGRAREAEPFLQNAVNADRGDFWAWFYLGLCRSDLGRHLEAADHFATCTALSPEFAWGYYNQGNELGRLGRLDDARTAYNAALELNPDFLEALVNRGLVCQESDPATAERDLARAWKLGYRNPAVLAAHAVALDRLGRSDEARQRFDQALQLHPNDPAILLGRAVYLLPRDPERSRADFETLVRLQPNHARARFGLAQLANDRGDSAEALDLLGAALRDDPTLIDAQELRAVIRGRLGDRKALDDVERLTATPSGRRLYNAACALARLAEREPDLGNRAVDLLREALRLGFPSDRLRDDPDLASIRDRADFPGNSTDSADPRPPDR